jgi:hypothetical protein
VSKREFLIATRGRTGSTALAAAFDQIEGVRCFAELLASQCGPCREGLSDSIWSKEVSEGGRCQSFIHYSGEMSLNEWWLMVRDQSSNTLSKIGFKVVGSVWLEIPNFLPFVKERFDVIYLTRDPVMQAISALYAKEIGLWNVPLADRKGIRKFRSRESRPVYLNPSAVSLEATYACNWQQEFTKMLDGMKGRFIEVEYEEVFNDQKTGRSTNELAAYFGVSEFSLGEVRYIQNLRNPEAQVMNLKEIKQHLVKQGFDLTQMSKITNL